MGEETLKIHSPHTYLHTNTNKDVTLFYIMYNHRGKAYYFYFKVFKGWEKRDSLFVLHDSSCFSRTRRFI